MRLNTTKRACSNEPVQVRPGAADGDDVARRARQPSSSVGAGESPGARATPGLSQYDRFGRCPRVPNTRDMTGWGHVATLGPGGFDAIEVAGRRREHQVPGGFLRVARSCGQMQFQRCWQTFFKKKGVLPWLGSRQFSR